MSSQVVTREGSRRTPTRNPRRRQRADNDSLPQPRRKRSKVTNDTFVDPHAEGHDDSRENPHVQLQRQRSATPAEASHMPLRGKKVVNKRGLKQDGRSLLTHNPYYSLAHLPSTPDAIRNSASDFTASFLPSASLALASNHSHAYIWDYSSSVATTHPKVFDVAFPSKPSDPLPLAALVTNGASTALGLIVVSATLGKITFWENIDTAESLSLFQERASGVHGSLGSLFSGELAVRLQAADHAGFIVTMSSGRIAHLSVRDAQGKPHISVQYLTSSSATSTGLFGSIKGALGVGWKRDVVRVHTRSQGARGQQQVISLSAGGQLQIWDLTWAGHSAYKGAAEMKPHLQTEFAKLSQNGGVDLTNLRLLDFAIREPKATGQEMTTQDDDQPIDLLLLASVQDVQQTRYALVDVAITQGQAYIERMIAIRGDVHATDSAQPTLIVPKPGHTAVLAYPKYIILVSLSAATTDGPDAQLMMETHIPPDSFQDILYLRQDNTCAVTGLADEDASTRHGTSSCLLFVKGFGLARLTITETASNTSSKMPARDMIEQAVVFGSSPDTILDFTRVQPGQYNSDDVERAASQISDDILCSRNEYISACSANMLDSFESRSKTLAALVKHITRHYGPISDNTRWQLLSDAEKLHAGRQLWEDYEDGVQHAAPKPSVVPAVIKVMNSQTRRPAKQATGPVELDEVRDWFRHDLSNLDKLCHQTLQLVIHGFESGNLQNLMKLISECDDILFAIYDVAYDFRSSHGADYGFSASTMNDGVLRNGWQDMPEPWSATHETLNLLDRFIDIARTYTVDFYEKPESQRESDNIYIVKVIDENVRLVQLLCRCYRERIAWCTAHYAEKYRNYAPSLMDKFRRSREHHLKGLVEIGKAGAGLTIAEKFRDMDALVKLVVSETAYLVESYEEPGIDAAEQEVITARMDELQANVKRYFEVFGDNWATAYFDSHLAAHQSHGLFKRAEAFPRPLTKYLRADKSRSRLGWINEVLYERNLSKAQTELAVLAREQEVKLWSKKVELSLGKLADLACAEAQADRPRADSGIGTDIYKDELTVISVQEEIYAHLQPLLQTAIDKHAEIQIITDAYAVSNRRKLPALHRLLELGLGELLNNHVLTAEQLIDVLTLIDSVPSSDSETDLAGREFFNALRVLRAVRPSMEMERFECLTRIVWKRMFLADDWDVLAETKGRSEADVQAGLRESTVCQTIFFTLHEDQASKATTSLVANIPLATITLQAGSSHADLAHRFPSSDLSGPIVHDNQTQDAKLEELIKAHDLDKWIVSCHEEAKKMIDEESHMVEEHKTLMQRQEEEMQSADCDGVHDTNGNANGIANGNMNGHANGHANDHDDEMEDGHDDMDLDGDDARQDTRDANGDSFED